VTGSAVPTIFLGSGDFAVPIATALARHPAVSLVGVVTAPLRGAPDLGSDVPIAEWAAGARVPALRPARLRDPDVVEQVLRAGPELLVLADYGQIVPAELLTPPRHGALNLHPSLLPRHRGASPVAAAILEDDGETGVTIIQMDAGLDTGPVVAQARYALDGTETAPELEARLALLAADLLSDTLEPYLAGAIVPQQQPVEGVTLTHPLRREDGRLDPVRGINYLDRQIRAYLPWPGTFFETEAGRVIVWDARPLGGGAMRRAGTLMRLPANRVALAASDGLLELVEVQPAGGRRMTGAELLRGRPQLAGTIVS
jgi:methionyl-tRNA formyltransferase